MVRLITYVIGLGLVFSGPAFSAEKKEENLESKLSYPELEVTPRASDRLEIEYKNERRYGWTAYLPIQLSAAATLYASSGSDVKASATQKEKDDYSSAQSLATSIGAGWLALTGVMSFSYKPYRSGMSEVSKLPKGSTREQLTRERIAEESLYAPDSLAKKMKWFSVATNLFATSMLMTNINPDSRESVGIGIAASLAPLIFDSRWSRVADQHREYKKKIYGPLASSTWLPTSAGRLVPALSLYWVF